jgi:hypothetical protein
MVAIPAGFHPVYDAVGKAPMTPPVTTELPVFVIPAYESNA